MYQAKILADSISPDQVRLTTYEVTIPRFLLPEFNTYRMLSRNWVSSRAIPTEKLITQVANTPFVPEFNERVKGMGVGDLLPPDEQRHAEALWLSLRDNTLEVAQALLHIDKSRVNRLLEPFAWSTGIITGTDWSNFFAQRTADSAQPEFQFIANQMRELYEGSRPWYCPAECWHIPLVEIEEMGTKFDYAYWRMVGTGRCARISYLTHDGRRDPGQDVGLHNRLLRDFHMSPFEHSARPFTKEEWEAVREQQDELRALYAKQFPGRVEIWCRQLEYCGPLRGWQSYRYEIPNQHDFSLVAAA